MTAGLPAAAPFLRTPKDLTMHVRKPVIVMTMLAALAGAGAVASTSALAAQARPQSWNPPVRATVFSPGRHDYSGRGGVGFIVDLALDATNAQGNSLLSAADGYKPFFNDPSASTFHPGSDPGAPGLVVLLSSTPTIAGTPFQGPRTNLAGLFQINGVARVGGYAETWNTWQPGKPIFGTDRHVVLTVFVVRGTAPALVPMTQGQRISNTVHIPFTIAP
jgi:hypothetical protein